MYLDYWDLQKFPFENVPNPSFLYHSPQHEEAILRLFYAVQHRKGGALLTGEVGAGKTTVSRALINKLPEDEYEVLTIVNPALDSVEFIRAILLKMRLDANSNSKSILLENMYERLIQNANTGINTIIIIDEAHLIESRATFEELRMLFNMQSEDQFLITMIIMGQPPLIKKISALKPLDERIAIKYHLEPLNFENTVRYIIFRLKKAGASRGIFTKRSLRDIYQYSRGIPLRINNLCDRTLLIGLMRKAKLINSKIVLDAIEDLQ